MVVTGGLICSCGFQIIGVIGWLVKSVIIGWVCCWLGLRIARYFLGFELLLVFILNFWGFFFFFFHVDFNFFWVYRFDFLEDSVEERDFE